MAGRAVDRRRIGNVLALIGCSGCALTIAAALGQAQTTGPDAAPLRAEIRRVEAVLPSIPDRAAGLYLLARRHAALGELDRARERLRACLRLGAGFEPDTEALRPLQRFDDVRALADGFRRRHPAVHRARIAFTVPEPDLFPEGLAYDPDRSAFYLSSEYHNKIVKVDASRRVSDLVSPDRYRLSPVGGLRVDPGDRSVWAATDSAEFVHVDPDGRLLGRYTAPDPGPHILNDLVVRRSGDVYLTDTRAHLVYRFDRAAQTFTPVPIHRPLFYPNGITLSPDERLLFAADILGVVAVDLRSGQTFDVNPGPHGTMAGIDGLYWYNDGLVGVQYGTGASRAMRWRLSPDAHRVVSSAVLEYRTPLVSFPTTGAVVGDDFYFIANTGIGNLRDGRIVDPSKLEPVHVAIVALEQKNQRGRRKR